MAEKYTLTQGAAQWLVDKIKGADDGVKELKNHTRVNLLRPTLGTTTDNGVTCTANGDGTYTLNGTASAQTDFGLSIFILKAGKYKLTGNPNEVSTSAFWIGIVDTVNGWQIGELCFNKDGSLVNNTTEQQAVLLVRIYAGTVLNNLVFKPMITTDLTATYDDFVSYEDSLVTGSSQYFFGGVDTGRVLASGQSVSSGYTATEDCYVLLQKGNDSTAKISACVDGAALMHFVTSSAVSDLFPLKAGQVITGENVWLIAYGVKR